MVNAFLTIKHGLDDVGTLHLILYDDIVPRTVKNFTTILQSSGTMTYRNSVSHRLIKGFMAQFGDITKGDGTGGMSIYGDSFEDENFIRKHDRKGVLSMANSGPNTNGSQFFVTFRGTPHLDGKHVVFGHVDLEQSETVLSKLEKIKTDQNDKPLKPVVIVDCGVVDDENNSQGPGQPVVEINPHDSSVVKGVKPEEKEEIDIDEIEETEEEAPDEDGLISKSQAIKNRLRKLKMKMNQARQLNRKALMREGEAMGSEEGQEKQRREQLKQEKRLKQTAWDARHARAVKVADEVGVEAKYLVEPAASSVKNAGKRAQKRQASQFSVNDYHNPEGQHRHYERDLKSLPRNHIQEPSTDTYNPMVDSADPEREREGARRMANELYRRIDKQKNKRNRMEFDETDVSYINQRNKRFNQKISRNYDKTTAEIKQSLERGTAL